MMSNILADLNDQQLSSVITSDVPLRIIAGAGSGKTRVITTKIAYLIAHEKINPRKILAVTFTNKAANEMKNRVYKLTQQTTVPYIMTFHAFCVRVLREDFQAAGLTPNFQIIDHADQVRIVKDGLKHLDAYDPKAKEESRIIGKISVWKNKFLKPNEAEKESILPADKRYAKVYRYYQNHLEQNDKVDFDDLILKVHAVFKDNLEIRGKWQNRFDYVMVDEFQDTNYSQFDLIRWIVGARNCLTVVGDPDQNIYSWRGAKLSIILDFEQNYKNAKTIMLTQNYRSTKNILDLANKFIDNNKNRVKKDIFTVNSEGSKCQIKEAASKNFEAKFVAQEIKRLVDSGAYTYADIYVLYRTNAWSIEFEKELANAGIPYGLVGAFRFLERKEIKDVIALLKMVALHEDTAIERVFKFVPKIGTVTAQKIFDAARIQEISVYELLTQRTDLVNDITKHLAEFCQMLKLAETAYLNDERLVEVAKILINKSGLKDKLNLKNKDDFEVEQNIKTFLDQMTQFDFDYEKEPQSIVRVNKFLQDISLVTSTESETEVPNKVSLLTIHSAKGLENKVVFIAGLNQEVFPSRMSLSSIAGLEEERRAFYVAITRAQELLYISYVVGERSYITGGNELGPSRFIGELDPELYTIEKNIFFHSPGVMTSQKFSSGVVEKEPEKLDSGLEIGDCISHLMFGDGLVEQILDRFIKVAFKNPAFGVKSIPIKSSVWSKIKH
ncbi:ATP-dependent DNA helicase [Spiroplasma clarkii]|uniref:DNA 3'-5' helicase n=1 Tax=Spiroplasma clarkii TaxID=2139 RepID=A0A1Y0L2P6_9MOLU|nr:UvrD-helicase domain-containing protein [Spiroplasma clarkii]ARU92263.1 ATP-dependent DNA helicase [Spiroplasma clarkii]ATX71576.1 ATP-dependent DNA helicase [Spiroplasma clarkii]